MKKQYLPQFQFKKDEGTSTWQYAMMYGTTMKRYAGTLEEAQAALDFAIKKFDKGARKEHIDAGGLGATLVIDEQTAQNMQIVKTRIKVREVSDWKEV